jgi:phage-related minor tail protein
MGEASTAPGARPAWKETVMDKTDLDETLSTAQELRGVLDDLDGRSRSFGSALTTALKGAIVDGDSLGVALEGIAARFSSIALDVGLQPLQASLGTMFSGLTQSLSGALAFANGGVVNGPTYFPMAGGLGLMGEAGGEAIMPLKRGSDGRLGVAGDSGGGSTQIVFNVQAQDAASFRRSESQINAMLTRAVGRGRRGV